MTDYYEYDDVAGWSQRGEDNIVITITTKGSKMKPSTLTALIFMIAISIRGYGQPEVVTWETQSVKDLRNLEEYQLTCTFKVYAGERVDWIQGDATESYTITATQGALPETGPGIVVYTVSREGITGTFSVERSNSNETFVTLDLREGTPLGAYYKFQVSNP